MKKFIGSGRSHLRMFFALCFIALLIPTVASAQDPAPPHVGGHVGLAFPIETRSDWTTITISEDFIAGFPVTRLHIQLQPLNHLFLSCESVLTRLGQEKNKD